MSPLQVAARFAAFVWYSNHRKAPERILHEEARQFAEKSWDAFLPIADEGFGSLLLRVAEIPATRQRRVPRANHRSKRRRLAAAG
jgi:hypothetical protein